MSITDLLIMFFLHLNPLYEPHSLWALYLIQPSVLKWHDCGLSSMDKWASTSKNSYKNEHDLLNDQWQQTHNIVIVSQSHNTRQFLIIHESKPLYSRFWTQTFSCRLKSSQKRETKHLWLKTASPDSPHTDAEFTQGSVKRQK